MKKLLPLFIMLIATISGNKTFAQSDSWPQTINAEDGSIIKIFEPDPESFSGNILKIRAAISLLQPGKTDPVFGTYWAIETVQTDRDNRRINVISVKVPNVKFSGDVDANTVSYVKTTLESQIPIVAPDLSQDAVLASLETNTEEKTLSKGLETNPPKVIYADRPTILVTIDGTPQFQHNTSWNLDALVNSPFTIVKNTNGQYYLYGGKHWYSASTVTGPYSYVNRTPANLYKVQTAIDNANNSDPGFSNDSTNTQTDVVSNIIVSTTPAELIQTNGYPSFTNIDGTSLSYVNNTQNDIFLNNGDQQYYVLISGRWYKSPSLNGPWEYTASNALPSDFGKIPEGSPKDNVLASVAGTTEAHEAVMDAQIPQTAKVDRKNATANVTYDGDPKFEDIEGTHMQYATNTQSSVIYYHGRYFCVDNGVWFEAGSPNGPWMVCTNRPDEVDIIPPSYPVYNIKYVYIYDVSPDWVYMGYTPGYLNTFIYGPTVVYGTGFYYRPWRGRYYYPRPYTWGFNMHYNPWIGWSIGYNYHYRWFNHSGFGISIWNGWGGGWWGPAVYRPPFHINPYRSYGYYGVRPAGRPVIVNNVRVNNYYSNNIYNARRDAVTINRTTYNNRFNNASRAANNNTPVNRNNVRQQQSRGVDNVQQRSMPQQERQETSVTPRNNQPTNANIRTDREGNVYQRSNSTNAQWQQRQQNQWQPVNNNRPDVIQNLNRQQQMHDRGQQRTENFQRSREAVPSGNSSPRTARGNGGGGNGGAGNRGGGGRNGGGR